MSREFVLSSCKPIAGDTKAAKPESRAEVFNGDHIVNCCAVFLICTIRYDDVYEPI